MNKNKKYSFYTQNAALYSTIAISISIVLIILMLFINGVPAIFDSKIKGGAVGFFTGWSWSPNNHEYGILSMLSATLLTSILATLIATPLSIYASVYIVKYATKKYKPLIESIFQTLNVIPSVVFGFIGLSLLIPILMKITNNSYANSILIGVIVLTFMILPTITSIIIVSLKNVPKNIEEASYGLGATKEETIIKISIPYISKSIFSAIVLGLGRAIGEASAMLMIAGSVSRLQPGWDFLLKPFSTFTTTISQNMGDASIGFQTNILYALGVILFLFSLCLNMILHFKQKGKKKVKHVK